MNDEKIAVSENTQHIHAMRKPMIKTTHGKTRVMEEIGVIRGLALKKSKNYILIPHRVTKKGVEETTSWSIYALPSDHNVVPETWDRLHKEEEFVE